MHIVDNVGHYEFSIELFDRYGKPIDYELMQELKLEVNDEWISKIKWNKSSFKKYA